MKPRTTKCPLLKYLVFKLKRKSINASVFLENLFQRFSDISVFEVLSVCLPNGESVINIIQRKRWFIENEISTVNACVSDRSYDVKTEFNTKCNIVAENSLV